jgi:hypothetical protein|eukprot:COSAG01_NODE_9422_length_2450_cov_26.148022_2_plen_81_part_00
MRQAMEGAADDIFPNQITLYLGSKLLAHDDKTLYDEGVKVSDFLQMTVNDEIVGDLLGVLPDVAESGVEQGFTGTMLSGV